MDQVIQVLGSLLILAAFTATQRGALSQNSRTYLVAESRGLGRARSARGLREVLLLEACWAVVSAWGLAQQLRRRELSAPAH